MLITCQCWCWLQVFGCSGTGTSEALLAAIQRAVDDGMDIINLSLGEPSGYEAVRHHTCYVIRDVTTQLRVCSVGQ
jgi:subtilisin family serine protease